MTHRNSPSAAYPTAVVGASTARARRHHSYGWSVAEDGRARLLNLVTAVVVLAAAALHFVYLATHWNDRAMALLYGLIGVIQAWLAVALGLGRPTAARNALGVNTGLIALFFVARVVGPPMGIKPEVVDFLTVLRKSLEALSVILLALSLRNRRSRSNGGQSS